MKLFSRIVDCDEKIYFVSNILNEGHENIVKHYESKKDLKESEKTIKEKEG
ncbi:hypothetical protein RI065_03040 [Mycoplasmatota bacterium zrk1]